MPQATHATHGVAMQHRVPMHAMSSQQYAIPYAGPSKPAPGTPTKKQQRAPQGPQVRKLAFPPATSVAFAFPHRGCRFEKEFC